MRKLTVLILASLILTGCSFPSGSTDNENYTFRSDNDPDYVDTIINEFEISDIYMLEFYYFDEIQSFILTDIYDDMHYQKTEFNVVIGLKDNGEEIIVFIPQFEEYDIYSNTYELLSPTITISYVTLFNSDSELNIELFEPSSGYPFAGFNGISRLNDETEDVLEKVPVLNMMIKIGTYRSSEIGDCTVYVVKLDINEYALIANSNNDRANGYEILLIFNIE